MVVVAPHLILGFALSDSGVNLSAVLRSEVGIVKLIAHTSFISSLKGSTYLIFLCTNLHISDPDPIFEEKPDPDRTVQKTPDSDPQL